MDIHRRTLILAATLCGSLPVFEGCSHSSSAPERPPLFEIRWKGEDTGYRGKTVIHDDGKTCHD